MWTCDSCLKAKLESKARVADPERRLISESVAAAILVTAGEVSVQVPAMRDWASKALELQRQAEHDAEKERQVKARREKEEQLAQQQEIELRARIWREKEEAQVAAERERMAALAKARAETEEQMRQQKESERRKAKEEKEDTLQPTAGTIGTEMDTPCTPPPASVSAPTASFSAPSASTDVATFFLLAQLVGAKKVSLTLPEGANTRISTVKAMIEESNPAFEATRQLLIFGGRKMEDEKPLTHYKLKSGHTIHVGLAKTATPLVLSPPASSPPPASGVVPAATPASATSSAAEPTKDMLIQRSMSALSMLKR